MRVMFVKRVLKKKKRCIDCIPNLKIKPANCIAFQKDFLILSINLGNDICNRIIILIAIKKIIMHVYPLSLLSIVKTISEMVYFKRARAENNVTNILIRVSIGNVSRDR